MAAARSIVTSESNESVVPESAWITYAKLLVTQRQLDRLSYAIAELNHTVVEMAETIGGQGWQDATVIKHCHQLDVWEGRRDALIQERAELRRQLQQAQ